MKAGNVPCFCPDCLEDTIAQRTDAERVILAHYKKLLRRRPTRLTRPTNSRRKP